MASTPPVDEPVRAAMRPRIASAGAAARVAALLVVIQCVVGARPATAAVVGGGGSAKTDCLVVFEAPATAPARRPRLVRCADGGACDADGLVNGRCEFPVAVCANGTGDPRCTLAGVGEVTVAHALDDGDPDFDPEMQAVATRIGFVFDYPEFRADRCSAPTTLTVPVAGPFARGRCRSGTKTLRLLAHSVPIAGRVRTDADTLKLVCEPAPAGCAPRAFFASTFDRVQTQIFDRSCATGGCHDSETVQAELLLERGAAHGNLIGRTPTNADAAALGWQRVAAGDPAASYLVHKVAGTLGPGLGKRMPLHRPKLDDALVDVVRRWVAAGAPVDGWVAGTD